MAVDRRPATRPATTEPVTVPVFHLAPSCLNHVGGQRSRDRSAAAVNCGKPGCHGVRILSIAALILLAASFFSTPRNVNAAGLNIVAAPATNPTSFQPEDPGGGFIVDWLILGPYIQGHANPADGAMPGFGIGADFLRDQANTTEESLVPKDGLAVNTAYGVAASKGIRSVGGRNPSSTPTVFRWSDSDDTILFDDIFGGAVEDSVTYAFTYVTNETASEIRCMVGVASDDSILVLLDNEPVLAAIVARPVGAPRAVLNRASIIIPPGEHRLVVKIFNGTLGSGFRLRFEDADGRPVREGLRTSTIPRMTSVPPRLPRTLLVGSFTLDVDSYTSYAWDPRREMFTGVSGTARTSMQCEAGALSGIPVRFKSLRIKRAATPQTGTVVSGVAQYPDPTAMPMVLESAVESFTIRFATLRLEPAGATADLRVTFPPGVIDANTGDVPVIELPGRPIEPSNACALYVDFPQQAYGPWWIGETGIKISGYGLTLDLSRTQSSPGGFAPSWAGVKLGSGATAAVSGFVSNVGYLKAPYTFDAAVVMSKGFSANLQLASSYEFETLQPAGFRISLPGGKGALVIAHSKVFTGLFKDGTIAAPAQAVLDSNLQPVVAQFSELWVRASLDIYGAAKIPHDLVWGSLDRQPLLRAYGAIRPDPTRPLEAFFYFSPTVQAPFSPILPGGEFCSDPLHNAINAEQAANALDAAGLGGLVMPLPLGMSNHVKFTVFTPDLPTPNGNIEWEDGKGWLAVGATGVHGEIAVEPRKNVRLGPTWSSSYRPPGGKKEAFNTDIEYHGIESRGYSFLVQFVDSAVYKSDGQGKVTLAGPTQGAFGVEEIQFTSTAHAVAAKVTLNDPMKVKYWGLKVEGKPKKTHKHAGVVAFKLGEVVFTAAGLQEDNRDPTHFFTPLWLIWGEVFADGSWGQLYLDANSGGQRFDSFPFVAEAISLSRYDGNDKDLPREGSYLEVGGKVFFDFFGPSYLHIIDSYKAKENDKTQPAEEPFLGREITLASTPNLIDKKNPFLATDERVSGRWGRYFRGSAVDYGYLDFSLTYDSASQDGFTGDGFARFAIIAGDLNDSTIRMFHERICASTAETHDLSVELGLVNWGGMTRTTGCGCVAKGVLERVYLSSELSANADIATVVAKAGGTAMLEMILTPSTTELRVSGEMAITLVEGLSSLEVDGAARFLTDYKEKYVDGMFEGKLDATNLLQDKLGVNASMGLGGEGGLNWRFGSSASWVQGRLKIHLVSFINAEGGFFFGLNAPRAAAEYALFGSPRCALDTKLLADPNHITGVYAYAGYGGSVNLYIFSGGYEYCAGVGGFVGSSGPSVTAVLGARLWGDILGGLVGVSGGGTCGLTFPQMYFKGQLELGGCVLWVFCGSVDVEFGLNGGGFYIS